MWFYVPSTHFSDIPFRDLKNKYVEGEPRESTSSIIDVEKLIWTSFQGNVSEHYLLACIAENRLLFGFFILLRI